MNEIIHIEEENSSITMELNGKSADAQAAQFRKLGAVIKEEGLNYIKLKITTENLFKDIKSTPEFSCSPNELFVFLLQNGIVYDEAVLKPFFAQGSPVHYFALRDSEAQDKGTLKLGTCDSNKIVLLNQTKSNSTELTTYNISVPSKSSLSSNNTSKDYCIPLFATESECDISYYPNDSIPRHMISGYNTLGLDYMQSVKNNSTSTIGKFFIFSLFSFGAAAITVSVNNFFPGGGGNGTPPSDGPGEAPKKGYYPTPYIIRKIKIKHLIDNDSYVGHKLFPFIKHPPEKCEEFLCNKNPDKYQNYCINRDQDIEAASYQEWVHNHYPVHQTVSGSCIDWGH